MRVIAGISKGRRLLTLPGEQTRPTADKVKGALFNIMTNKLYGARVLDLFAGSGALGIEALSRGAAHCDFLEKSSQAADITEKNLENTKLTCSAQVIRNDVNVFLQTTNGKYDIVFLDPPYNKGMIPPAIEIISARCLLESDGIIAAECDNIESLPEKIGIFTLYDKRKYGRVLLNFYKIL